MATNKSPPCLGEEIHTYNRRLDHRLRSRYGMSLRIYKIIKAITQLVGVVAGVYAMTLGADPMTALAMIALIYAGPEVIEHILLSANNFDQTGASDE